MQTIEEDFYGCKIILISPQIGSKVYWTKHNKSNMELHTFNLAEALRAAKLLELDFRVCDWFHNVY